MLFPMTRKMVVSRIKRLWLNGKFLVKKIVCIEKLKRRKEKVARKVIKRIEAPHHLLLLRHLHQDGKDDGMSRKNQKTRRLRHNGMRRRNLRRSVLDGIKPLPLELPNLGKNLDGMLLLPPRPLDLEKLLFQAHLLRLHLAQTSLVELQSTLRTKNSTNSSPKMAMQFSNPQRDTHPSVIQSKNSWPLLLQTVVLPCKKSVI